MKLRLDELLVRRDMVLDLKEARGRILAGEVIVNDKRIDKVGQMVPETAQVRIRPRKGRVFVSRGGEKLDYALEQTNTEVENLVCLDLGASTGGFTDCLLRRGARTVYAVDVGYGLLDWRLRTDARVVNLERTHAAKLTDEHLRESIDFACADLSFTSLENVIPSVTWALAPNAMGVFLVKPQFEAAQHEIGAGGIVTDPSVHQRVCAKSKAFLEALGFADLTLVTSPIKGAKGNMEFLLVGRWCPLAAATGDEQAQT